MFVPFCTRILLGAALIFPLAAHAVDTPLTLHDAQRRAIERSRQLAAQDAAVMANREMAVAAGQFPDPVVKIGIDNLPINGADRFSLSRDFMTMRRLGVMQEFTRADKRQLRSERFEREAQRTLAEKAATSVTIERDVALAWFDRYYLDAMATIVDQKIEKARIESQAVDANYRGGRASRADRLMAKNTLVELEDRASEFRRRRLNSKVALARWVGDDNSLPLGERPDITVLRWNTQGLHQQLTHHPQLAILEKQEQIASTEAQLAQANKKSDWSWEVGFSQRGSTYSNMVSIGVSIPWQSNSSGRQDRDIAARLAMVEQAKAQREDALRAHVAEVSAMVNEWENGKERLARYTNERMPLTDERIEAVMTAYRGGKANLSDVLVVHRNALEVHLQALQLEWETARLWAQLNFLFPLAKGEMQ